MSASSAVVVRHERIHAGHFCQIHQHESSLVQAVVRFLAAGVVNGDALVVITRRKRQALVLDWLKAKLPAAAALEQEGRLFVHSSNELLDAILCHGAPDWSRFEPLADAVLRAAAAECQRVRLYGDAVSELWQMGRHSAAVELESFWNRVLLRYPRTEVFCGYLIDALAPQSYSEQLAHLGREHCVISPGTDQLKLQCCIEQAAREVLGRAPSVCRAGQANDAGWRERLPLPMRLALWLLENEPDSAGEVLQRARRLYTADRRRRTPHR